MRRSPQNVTITFDDAGMTHYGSAFFLHQFVRVLQIRNFLAHNLKWDCRNSDNSLSQMVLALAWPSSWAWIASKPRHCCVPRVRFNP